MDILRFITAGNVDDGKSTLIGRLLYDTKNIKSDVLQSVAMDNSTEVNLAYITDGLRSEREQGITIDIAYKYFTTTHRKYIISDAPGHFQFTKNLVTGASGVDVMIILIDAQNGITEQTRRHSLVASFLMIKQVVVAINKMDAVGYDEQIFNTIETEYEAIAAKLQLHNVAFIPMSALHGDNVTCYSEKMRWYTGITLMHYLETCKPVSALKDILRFSVQCVIDSDKEGFEQAYAGKILSGSLKVSDVVSINPNPKNEIAIIQKIVNGYKEVQEAKAGENICLYLLDWGKVHRGNVISGFHMAPRYSDQFVVSLCWLDAEQPLLIGEEYILRIGVMESICSITEVINKTDVATFEKKYGKRTVEVNEFASVRIKTKEKILYDAYAELPETGRGILIDIKTNYTSGALVIS